MPFDSDPGFWKWLVGAITTGVLTMFGYHKSLEAKINKKADKEDVASLE